MSDLHAKLMEYIMSRGMDMPVYHNGSKITEEAQELRDALRHHLAAPSQETLFHLMEECADVVFCAAVAAHQAGFSLEDAIDMKIAKDKDRNRV